MHLALGTRLACTLTSGLKVHTVMQESQDILQLSVTHLGVQEYHLTFWVQTMIDSCKRFRVLHCQLSVS